MRTPRIYDLEVDRQIEIQNNPPCVVSTPVYIPVSPGCDQIWVDFTDEILSSRLPSIKAMYRRVLIGFFPLHLLLGLRPHHANVLRQDMDESLGIFFFQKKLTFILSQVPEEHKLKLDRSRPILSHRSDPVGHDVCAGRTVVQIEDDHAQDDREGDQDHGEHDIVDNNWDAQGSLRDFVSQQQHEHSLSDEDRN